jgi:RND family efflux transporter MFP subunit
MKSRTIAFVVPLGLALLGSTILQARSASRAAAAAPAAVSPARRIAAEGRVTAYPGAESVVGSERAGRVVRVPVVEGQAVRRGELLVELDAAELKASLDEARAGQAEAEADLRLAEATLKRRQDLHDQLILSAHDLDQARRDLEAAEARLATAHASVARLEVQLGKMQILAPFAGTVTARHVEPGETIDAGAKVVTLADLGRLRIEGEADETDAGALKLGALVTIRCDAYPGRTWRGRVEELADSVTLRKLKPQDPGRPTDTRILSVKVAFAEPNPLRLGTTVELGIDAPAQQARSN